MKLVITMSRRFGTGASIIASELSERLGVPVYDKAYIEEKINDHEYESEAEAIRKLADEERAAYYYEHTGKTWGDVNDYHMILDTSELGVENCADILMHYFEKLEYI